MEQHPPQLPQHGWFLDTEWVDSLYGKMSRPAFERRLKTFRTNIVHNYFIAHFKWGDRYVIHTRDYYEMDTEGMKNGIIPQLPQSGVFTDHEWAAAFEEEVCTFRRKVRMSRTPHLMRGTLMLVRAEDLYSHLAELSGFRQIVEK